MIQPCNQGNIQIVFKTMTLRWELISNSICHSIRLKANNRMNNWNPKWFRITKTIIQTRFPLLQLREYPRMVRNNHTDTLIWITLSRCKSTSYNRKKTFLIFLLQGNSSNNNSNHSIYRLIEVPISCPLHRQIQLSHRRLVLV